MRTLWFAAGAGVGMYALTRARRAAEMLTPDGWSDRRASLRRGAQLFAESYTQARADKEFELRERLSLASDTAPALASGSEGPMTYPSLRSVSPEDPKDPH